MLAPSVGAPTWPCTGPAPTHYPAHASSRQRDGTAAWPGARPHYSSLPHPLAPHTHCSPHGPQPLTAARPALPGARPHWPGVSSSAAPSSPLPLSPTPCPPGHKCTLPSTQRQQQLKCYPSSTARIQQQPSPSPQHGRLAGGQAVVVPGVVLPEVGGLDVDDPGEGQGVPLLPAPREVLQPRGGGWRGGGGGRGSEVEVKGRGYPPPPRGRGSAARQR